MSPAQPTNTKVPEQQCLFTNSSFRVRRLFSIRVTEVGLSSGSRVNNADWEGFNTWATAGVELVLTIFLVEAHKPTPHLP